MAANSILRDNSSLTDGFKTLVVMYSPIMY